MLKAADGLVLQGINYTVSPEADMVAWRNYRVAGGRRALMLSLGLLLLWMSAVLAITNWAILGGLAGPVGRAVVLAAWASLLVPLDGLWRIIGRDSIRVTCGVIEFRFARLIWPRKIAVPRGGLRELTLDSRDKVCGNKGQRLRAYLSQMHFGRPSTLVLARWMDDERKVELHALLCEILAGRGWVIEAKRGPGIGRETLEAELHRAAMDA